MARSGSFACGRMAARRLLVAVPVAGLLAAASPAAAADATPRYAPKSWGADTVARDCVVCHSLEAGGSFRVAPGLYGIVGAEKARARSWYAYSQALLAKGGTWSEDDLDRYLADARAFAPGSTKTIRIADAELRREIIDYLKTLGPQR